MNINRLLISILIIILIFSLISISGCTSWFRYLDNKMNPDIDSSGRASDADEFNELSDEEEKALDEALAAAEDEIEAEQEKEEKLKKEEEEREEKQLAVEEAELREGLEEEEELIPNEPITYSGECDGVNIIIVIDFKTTKVSGTVSLGGDYWADAEIVGIVNIENFEVNAAFDGMCGSKESGDSETFRGSIEGTVTGDLKAFTGNIIDNEGWGGEFTAAK